MTYLEALQHARASGYALLATNFYNVETLFGVLRAARETDSVLILQTSPSTLDYLNIPTAVALARAGSQYYGVKTYLHLDHATDLAQIEACIDAGWDSVMIDASESDMDTNIRKTKRALELAAPRKVSVEAELGYIPKLGQADVDEVGLTTRGSRAVCTGNRCRYARRVHRNGPRLLQEDPENRYAEIK